MYADKTIANAPLGDHKGVTGRLKASIKPRKAAGVATWTTEATWDVVVRGKGYAGFMAHMIEFGHSFVEHGRIVGYYPPNPFMLPAFNSETPAVIALFVERIKAHLARYRV
jgi:hypothetical protein